MMCDALRAKRHSGSKSVDAFSRNPSVFSGFGFDNPQQSRVSIQKRLNILLYTLTLIRYDTIWSRDEGIPLPNLNEVPDLDDPSPEGNVTKNVWKNLYQGIEQRREKST
jgi:hypothetical protein